jgi:signal transduction histidine kinase
MSGGTKSVDDPEELERKLSKSLARLREAQSQLERAQKLATVGSLVTEVAHEINTPLASLRSNTDTLTITIQRLRNLVVSGPGKAGTTEELGVLLSVADDAIRTDRLACERISNIAQNLRESLPPLDAGFVRADIQPEIENSLALLAHAFRNRIRLIKDYAVLPEIECDPGRLGQVFLNILVNAAQAIEGQGEIRIRAWQEGNTVRVAVSDTGKGIPAELQPRLFEPGFTTKGAGEGTGLGLFICRRIIQQHGGFINVESREGRGATFTVVLPIWQTQERTSND